MFVGIDIVKNERFSRWFLYTDQQLGRVFHPVEVATYRELFTKKPEMAVVFLASRYAVKEAFFKAYFACAAQKKLEVLPFLTLAPQVLVQKNQKNIPQLIVEPFLRQKVQNVSLSISHETCCSVAMVILY
jgi:phosphopantetheine--protein transferase-like protein